MKRVHELELRLHSLSTLHQAVAAMKSLAGHHLREARLALAPAAAYREGVDRVIASTGAWVHAGDGGVGLLVIGAELGFCGGYNVRAAEAGAAQRERSGAGPSFCLGHRSAQLLRRLDVTLEQVYTGPTSVEGITEVLLSVVQDLLVAYVERGLSGFDVVASRFGGVGAQAFVCTRLLPIRVSASPGAAQPRYAPAQHLREVAVQELLYVRMFELLLDALAAEHGARLAAAQAAEQRLSERVEQLHRRLLSAKREATTQEVIEIATGARARV